MEDDLTQITARPQFRCNYSAQSARPSSVFWLHGTACNIGKMRMVLHAPPPHWLLVQLVTSGAFHGRKDSSAPRPCLNCVLTLVGLKEGWHEGSDNDSRQLLWDRPFDINQHTHVPEDNSNTGTDARKGAGGRGTEWLTAVLDSPLETLFLYLALAITRSTLSRLKGGHRPRIVRLFFKTASSLGGRQLGQFRMLNHVLGWFIC